MIHLEFPADLPSGAYEFRLVVYDVDSMIPTVETGVWEPEVILARLRFGERR